MEEDFIQSRQNPRVKLLIKLQERSGRKRAGLFVVEGLRELSRCVESVGVEEIYFCPEFFKTQNHSDFIDKIRSEAKINLCRLSEGAFEKISNREGCDGLIGVAKQWGSTLSDIDLPKEKPVLLIADGIEKPGNLGGLVRSADSLGASAIILTNSITDIFNPAVIRASQGAVFSLPIVTSTPSEVADWLKSNKIKSLGAHLAATELLWQVDMSQGCAIVVGSEKDGLGEDWNSLLDCKVKIPMSGLSDSMNVNVAASIFLYEAIRGA